MIFGEKIKFKRDGIQDEPIYHNSRILNPRDFFCVFFFCHELSILSFTKLYTVVLDLVNRAYTTYLHRAVLLGRGDSNKGDNNLVPRRCPLWEDKRKTLKKRVKYMLLILTPPP